jgi:MFS family permease
MGCVVTFIPLFGRTLGVEHMAWFFPVYAGASFVGVRLGAVGLAARWGRRRVLGISLVLAAVAMAGLSALPWLPAALGCAVLYGVGYSTAQTLLTASLLEAATEKTRGLANAVNFAAMDVGMTVGPVGAGAFAEVFSIRWVYLLAAVSVLAALVVHGALGKRNS